MKITDLTNKIHAIGQNVPVDEIKLENWEGEIFGIEDVYYNDETGLIHIKIFDPEEEDLEFTG
jgi:hypothetical protein